MKPYSIDFRQKILDVYETENSSIRQLARRFGVAKSFIQKLIKQNRETGDINPKRQGGSPEPLLKEEEIMNLVEILETQNDATLMELCELLEARTQVRVSRATMGRITRKLNYTWKKKRSTPQKKKVTKIRGSE
jgi:transposase